MALPSIVSEARKAIISPDSSIVRHGLITDVTFEYCISMYLASTTMLFARTNYLNGGHYVTVLQSLLGGLTAEHYSEHFEVMFELYGFPKATSALTDNEEGSWVGMVVDFSVAQRNGFCMAYARKSIAKKHGLLTDEERDDIYKKYLEDAATFLKGCLNHFKASVLRVARNRGVVSEERVTDFNKIVQDMLLAPTNNEFEQLRKMLTYHFPNSKQWLE